MFTAFVFKPTRVISSLIKSLGQGAEMQGRVNRLHWTSGISNPDKFQKHQLDVSADQDVIDHGTRSHKAKERKK